MDTLPFCQACENNKSWILDVLTRVFADRRQVLEIAAGTGQHACHFATNMPWLAWLPTELPENMPVLHARCAAYAGDNLLPERALDVCDEPWPVDIPDALFSANSLHIMAFSAVEKLFATLGNSAGDDVVLAVYGPFNYHGRYTSDGNARFDRWLAQQSADSAIRHFEDVDHLAADAGFELQGDYEMPANNRLLVWAKQVGK
ncbi:MAG: methylase [Gammaproteobacteria bacterium]|nr:MAG: methylase [Gammaproteobacteria bacterium]